MNRRVTDVPTTRARLLEQARRLFWRHGYSNVPLRTIARAAQADVALVSRHFGGKRGLFEATLEEGYAALHLPDEAGGLADYVVALYAEAPRGDAAPSLIQMLTSNAHDEEVGGMVRDLHRRHVQARLERLLGGQDRAALFMSVLIGFAVAEKSLHLEGIAPAGSPEFERQLRSLMQAALSYGD